MKQAIVYTPTTSEKLTWLAQQSDRTYNETVATTVAGLASGTAVPRTAYASEDAPAGDSMLKKLTQWRTDPSWACVPLGVQRPALGETMGAVARWNAVREQHLADIVKADVERKRWREKVQKWKTGIGAWQARLRKGKRPAHPGPCKGLPRRAERGNPDETRLFKKRTERERSGTHQFSCTGDQLLVQQIDRPKMRRKEAIRFEHAPGHWVKVSLPGSLMLASHVYLAPGESIAKAQVRERLPTRARSARNPATHTAIAKRAPSERAYRCIITIGRKAPRMRDPGGRWAGGDPGTTHPCTFIVDGESEPRFVDFPEHRIDPLQLAIDKEVTSRRHQRRGSRRWQASWNRHKHLDRKLRNLCDDTIVKALHKLLDHIDAIGYEHTQWKNLIASAKGTSLFPGTNVAAKRALNRRIAAVAPGRMRLKLASMCAKRGVWLDMTKPAHSSTTCNQCGKTSKKNRPSQAAFKCIECGHEDHADANGAKNHRETGRSAVWKRLHRQNERFDEKCEKRGDTGVPSAPKGGVRSGCPDAEHERAKGHRGWRRETLDQSTRNGVKPNRNAVDGRTRTAQERSV